jgi:hypothetical protein
MSFPSKVGDPNVVDGGRWQSHGTDDQREHGQHADRDQVAARRQVDAFLSTASRCPSLKLRADDEYFDASAPLVAPLLVVDVQATSATAATTAMPVLHTCVLNRQTRRFGNATTVILFS